MKIQKFIEYINEAKKKKKKKKKKKSSGKRKYGNTWPNPNVSPFGYLLPFSRFYNSPDVINNNINISTNSGDGSTTVSGDGADVSDGGGGE